MNNVHEYTRVHEHLLNNLEVNINTQQLVLYHNLKITLLFNIKQCRYDIICLSRKYSSLKCFDVGLYIKFKRHFNVMYRRS